MGGVPPPLLHSHSRDVNLPPLGSGPAVFLRPACPSLPAHAPACRADNKGAAHAAVMTYSLTAPALAWAVFFPTSRHPYPVRLYFPCRVWNRGDLMHAFFAYLPNFARLDGFGAALAPWGGVFIPQRYPPASSSGATYAYHCIPQQRVTAMPVLSIAEAARRAGVDPGTIRRKLDRGKLSATTRPDGTKGVELSELARLYPQATTTASSSGMQQHAAADLGAIQRDVELLQLRQENEMLKQRLEETRSDRDWLRGQVEHLQQRLLPAPKRGIVERLGELVEKLRKR